MKAMLIDDEPLARRELRRLLGAFPWLEIVGEAGTVDEAVEKIAALAPDLLFLDIQMPGGSGFDLLERIDRLPQVIFATAYDRHAVRAFEVNALDYLLKPIEPERLAASLARARAAHVPSGAIQDRLFVRDGQRRWLVPLNEVRLLAAEDNYVRLYWGELQPLLSRALSTIEPHLDPERFFRANRAQIVNLDFIERMQPETNGRLHLTLRDGPEVEISRRQARLFRSRAKI